MIVIIKKIIKKILLFIGINPVEIHRYIMHLQGRDFIENVCSSKYEKKCLLRYITAPFFDNKNKAKRHQNLWQVRVLAREINKRGYNVDVLDCSVANIKLKYEYDMLIDIHPANNSKYLKYIKKDAKKIVYLTGSNPSLVNDISLTRLHEAEKRKGKKLDANESCRLAPFVSKDIEDFDAVFFMGNEYNLKSYLNEFNLPPVYYIINNGYKLNIPFDISKKKANNFLFFASSGQVHKGLDLLLEIFSQKNFSCELHICSMYKNEKTFCKVYEKELFSTSNIHAHGFVDIDSEIFKNIAMVCAYLIVPSCGEGQMGAALTAMSAGVIPILSSECGIDEAITLKDITIDTVEQTIIEYSKKNMNWIEKEAMYVKEIVLTNYSREKYINSVNKGLDKVLKE